MKRRVTESQGQALVEYVVALTVLMVIIMALVALGGWWQQDDVTQESFLDKTYRSIPYAPSTTRGDNPYFIDDLALP